MSPHPIRQQNRRTAGVPYGNRCRRGAAVVPEAEWMDRVFGDDPGVLDVYSPGAYGPPERRAEHAATLARLRAGDGEHVQLD